MQRKTEDTKDLNFKVPIWLHRYFRLRAADRDIQMRDLLAALVARDILQPLDELHSRYFIGCGQQLLANPEILHLRAKPTITPTPPPAQRARTRRRTAAGRFAEETWPSLETVCNALAKQTANSGK